jgi:P-type Cu2+ transporter
MSAQFGGAPTVATTSAVPSVFATESAGEAAAWLSDHRGPLTVTDNFVVLDDPHEQSAFTEYTEVDGQRCARSILLVQGMYCAACADTVESVLQHQPGVRRVQVHAATRRLTVDWEPEHTRMSTLADRVGQTGYRLLPLHEALSISERIAQTRQALWRLFLAGFCMMQVMMYAWPAYVAEPGDIPADIDQLLRWASWVISLPVVFWASSPFFSQAWRDLKRGRIGMDTPVSVGILVTFVASTAATFDPTGPWGAEVWFDSLTMFVFFLLGGRYLEFKARDRTAGALDSLMNRLPEVCERLKSDGQFESVSVRRLQLGDRVRIHAGQAVPADGELLSASATVDEALLTGESRPLTRQRGDELIAGSYNLAGSVELRVDRIGKDTRFAQIVGLMEKASTDKPRLAILADRIASPFLVLVMLAAAGAAWYWWQIDRQQALAVAVAVLIVTCPCALALATPTAMLASAGALARGGILVRRLQAFESLAEVDMAVFDKTGTLTEDRLELVTCHTRAGTSSADALRQAAFLAEQSMHPLSRALVRAVAQPLTCESVPDWQEHAGQGIEARWSDGRTWRLGSAAFVGVSPVDRAALSASDDATVWLGDERGWVARFDLRESVRADAKETIAALQSLGLRTIMLSGDQPQAAHKVAATLGITEVHAQTSPQDKLEWMRQWQAQGHKVAMVGDGLNDGPVLALAHTSFALGKAAGLTQAQADFVLQGGQLSDVLRTWRQARDTLRIVKQNLLWAAGYNVVSVPLAVAGYMPPWAAGLGMALSSLLVIGNALRLSRQMQD